MTTPGTPPLTRPTPREGGPGVRRVAIWLAHPAIRLAHSPSPAAGLINLLTPLALVPWWSAVIGAVLAYALLRYGFSFLVLSGPAAKVIAGLGTVAVPVMPLLIAAAGLVGALLRRKRRTAAEPGNRQETGL